MAQSIELLRSALEFEDLTRDKLNEVLDFAVHEDTKAAIRKILETKQENIDAIQWLIMAEAGKVELKHEESTVDNGATRLAKGKCPFSATELNKMGFNVTDEQLGRK